VVGTRQGMTVRYTISDLRIIDVLDTLRSIMRDGIQRRVSLIEEALV
jgi:hypothetical protein